MMKQLYLPLRAALCLLFLLPACTNDEDGADLPTLPQGEVNVYLAVKPWTQTELDGIYLAVNELMLAGPEGLVRLDDLLTGERVNLLDYQDEPLLLGSQSLAAGPYAAYQVQLGLIPLGQRNYKVPICHRPPGNPNNSRTLYLPACAVPAHTAHGDFIGACAKSSDDDDDDNDGYHPGYENARQQDDDDDDGEKHPKFSLEPDQFSYLTFTEGYSALLFGEETQFTGLVDFEVIEGATTEVLITLDLEASLSEFPLPQDEQVKEDDDDDDDDDNGRSSNGRQLDDDDDDGGSDDDDDDGGGKGDDDDDDDGNAPSTPAPACEFLYQFDPVVTVEVLAQEGSVRGVYTGAKPPGRTFTVFVYAPDTYSDAEADRRNPFPNALLVIPADNTGAFSIEALTAGSYDFIVGEFLRDRFIKTATQQQQVTIQGNRINEVELK